MTNFETFHQLHYQTTPFILANVWNVKSAKVVEACGFKAMATSSGAIAESLGYRDGEEIPFPELLYVVKRIKLCTGIPLSVDLERGYTDDLSVLNDHIQNLIDTGVAGINLEDAQGEDGFLRKLDSIKNYLVKTGQQLFINARTDAFLQKLPGPLEIVLSRATRYKDAGADGLFVTAVSDAELIRKIVAGTSLPVNVVGIPKLSMPMLATSGVKRISMAVFLYRATYHKMEAMASEVLNGNSFEPLFN
ncbi:isocitrate lyase/PEP mutase family protein [Fulvivirgaceae bacterium PWU4]|uniref:Isocitrate lyase/PEP mutase family protein n=1 Tax=Chryseosolibacter histidini TaxID=2782349 RepID=A0AAP2DQB6_9BACT|nr:isocitrate lyase/phosphoenolpyruvate mutase family protein [Chryseosolibacter histidini]MBT1698384.1 isocitrate lyase/PEP mutase family protein [Chryseosolibacter histidini]